MKTIFLITSMCLIFSLGCGIKGPPLPPIETVGEKLNAVQIKSGDNSRPEDKREIKK